MYYFIFVFFDQTVRTFQRLDETRSLFKLIAVILKDPHCCNLSSFIRNKKVIPEATFAFKLIKYPLASFLLNHIFVIY